MRCYASSHCGNKISMPIKEEVSSSPSKKVKPGAHTAVLEYQDKEQQRQILKESLGGARGYVTTNYSLAKRGRKTGASSSSIEKDYKEQRRIVQALEKTSRHLATETDIDTILKSIAETTAKALGAKYVNFWDLTPDRKRAFVMAHYGMQDQYMEHSQKDPIPIGMAWIGRALSTGQAWATSDVQTDPLLPRSWLPAVKKQAYHGLLCKPLMKRDQVIGGMCIYFKDRHQHQLFEFEIATIVANQAATALENSRIIRDLEAERNKTLSIIQSLNDGLIMYDLEGRVIMFNPKAEELFWIKREDVLGKTVSAGVSGDQAVPFENLGNIYNLTQTDYSTKEYTTVGPHKVVLKATFIPVRDERKLKIGSMHILRDITPEKEVELLKSSFISTASHQLRTPLTGIKWFLQSLSSGTLGPLNDEQRELLEGTSAVNEHLIQLVNDLLDASRIEEGRFGYTFKPEDITPIVTQVLDTLKFNAQKQKISLEFVPPAELPPQVILDREHIALAIQNVIDNAIKYSRPGSVVRVALYVGKTLLSLIVQDHGIGIAKEDHKFIFSKFFRAPNAIEHQTEGSGLGLYIAKNIVDKHNGLIYFESDPRTGTTFTIQFSLDPKKAPQSSSQAEGA